MRLAGRWKSVVCSEYNDRQKIQEMWWCGSVRLGNAACCGGKV